MGGNATESTTPPQPAEGGDQHFERSGYRITYVTTAAEFGRHHVSLRTLLQLCVNPDPAGSSIGFRAPLTDADADAFWQQSVAAKLEEPPAARTLHLFVVTSPSEPGTGVLATAQILTIPKVTHSHRAEVAKLLVHPSARRCGVATTLMAFVEEFARDRLGRDLLMLDTASETPAVKFYTRIGWRPWGTCPQYAEYADGRRCDAVFFLKFLREGNMDGDGRPAIAVS